jgi:fumarylacetoacetase
VEGAHLGYESGLCSLDGIGAAGPPALDRSHDASARSWVAGANGSTDFPVQNLPYAIFHRAGEEVPGPGVAIGDRILDLRAPAVAAIVSAADPAAAAALNARTLKGFAALEPGAVTRVRLALFDALTNPARQPELEPALVPMSAAVFGLPFAIGDFTDFYSSIFHATRVGSLFRPNDPLKPNYKYVPVGYHGRSSSIVVDGTPVRRPNGQLKAEGSPPVYAASKRLDYEAEIGFYVGRGTKGELLEVDDAASRIFGFTLLNDWSARDIQMWEYEPLGPFLGKSFATTVSPWVVTLDALRPFRCPSFVRAAGDPEPLAYLSSERDRAWGGVDIQIDVELRTAQMRETGMAPQRLSRSGFADAYWTYAQMTTHHTSNGCNLRSGDLLGSGTMSGPGDDPSMRGTLIELTGNGRDPLTLPNGETRAFLTDGDEITLRGRCERPPYATIGFGTCGGVVTPRAGTAKI